VLDTTMGANKHK